MNILSQILNKPHYSLLYKINKNNTIITLELMSRIYIKNIAREYQLSIKSPSCSIFKTFNSIIAVSGVIDYVIKELEADVDLENIEILKL